MRGGAEMVHKLQGLYFEDYKVGAKFEPPSRTITDAEISYLLARESARLT